jgi:phosphopantetheinyl transferase (holo-ACP synthase)
VSWPALDVGRCVTLESGVALLALPRESRTLEPVLCGREHAILEDLKDYPLRVSEWLAGRAAAKGALHDAFGFAPEVTEVLPLESGAPEVYVRGARQTTVFLNITHTRRYAVAAAARVAVGVDVCDDADGHRLERIAQRVFSDGEAEACGAHASAQHQAAVWAIKEAVLKLRIGGVFDPGAKSVRVVSLEPPRVADAEVRVQVLRLPEAACAVAVGGGR